MDTLKEAKLVFCSLAATDLAQVSAAIAALSPAATRPAVEPEAQRTPAPGVANFARMF